MDYKNCYVIVYTTAGNVQIRELHEQASVWTLIQYKVRDGLIDGPVPFEATVTAYDANGNATELLSLTIENRFQDVFTPSA